MVTKVENPILRDIRIWPLPLQVEQVVFDVPVLHPDPLQTPQSTSLGTSISIFLPCKTSSSVIDVSYSKSAPFCLPKPPKPPPLPKTVSKIDSNPPDLPNISLKISLKSPLAPWKISSVLYLPSTPA